MDVVTLASALCPFAPASSRIATAIAALSPLAAGVPIASALTIEVILSSLIEREDEAP